MIISEAHAKKLIRNGQAIRHGWCKHDGENYYTIITRYDKSRTDHYYLRGNSREYAVMLGATK